MPSHATNNLGSIIKVFRYQPLGWSDAARLFLPGSLAVLIPLLYGLSRARFGILYYGSVAAEHWSRPWFLLAMIAASVLVFAAISRILASRRYLIAYERGLVLNLGGKKYTLRWEEIAGVTTETIHKRVLSISLRPNVQGVIYPNIGKPVRLDNSLQDLPELLTILKAKLYPRLLPHLQSNFQSGQWLHFGLLAIQDRGIKLLNQRKPKLARPIPWSHVAHMNIESGFLVVELSDRPRLKLPVSKIPNIELLLQLIKLGVNS